MFAVHESLMPNVFLEEKPFRPSLQAEARQKSFLNGRGSHSSKIFFSATRAVRGLLHYLLRRHGNISPFKGLHSSDAADSSLHSSVTMSCMRLPPLAGNRSSGTDNPQEQTLATVASSGSQCFLFGCAP